MPNVENHVRSPKIIDKAKNTGIDDRPKNNFGKQMFSRKKIKTANSKKKAGAILTKLLKTNS